MHVTELARFCFDIIREYTVYFRDEKQEACEHAQLH